VAASFLTKDLGIHWLRGERFFAAHLNDFDLAANRDPFEDLGSFLVEANTFDPAANTMTARTFSPKLGVFESDADSAFTVPFSLAGTQPAPFQAIGAVKAHEAPEGIFTADDAPGEIFGENVFSKAVMQKRLPKTVYKSLLGTIDHAQPLDPVVADIVASAKKHGGRAEYKTVNGETLAFVVKGKSLTIVDGKGGTAKVQVPNVYQSNGVVHVINNVLLPK